jgi:hypothetical protein
VVGIVHHAGSGGYHRDNEERGQRQREYGAGSHHDKRDVCRGRQHRDYHGFAV